MAGFKVAAEGVGRRIDYCYGIVESDVQARAYIIHGHIKWHIRHRNCGRASIRREIDKSYVLVEWVADVSV
jgi:hypothetical protein